MIGLLLITPIHKAASRGDVETIRYLHEEFGLDLNLKDAIGFTPLHDAVINGKIAVVRYLIENGAAINPKSGTNSTPLHFAAKVHFSYFRNSSASFHS